MAIELRSLNITDLDEVLEIEPVAFGSHHWSHQSFVNELSNSMGNYFAAIDNTDNRLLGYSGFWLIGEEAHITTLAVHPDFRRKYVGERLLVNDIVHAKIVGAHWITLEVRMSNESAQKLYFKYGFKSLGVRRHYYQDNDEDALVLWTENIQSPEFVDLIHERVRFLKELGIFSALETAETYPEVKVNGRASSGQESAARAKRNQQASLHVAHQGADEC
jgi:ribosomal-protein-alanine N-acetyltransferase